jgi:hypothetical protein
MIEKHQKNDTSDLQEPNKLKSNYPQLAKTDQYRTKRTKPKQADQKRRPYRRQPDIATLEANINELQNCN